MYCCFLLPNCEILHPAFIFILVHKVKSLTYISFLFLYSTGCRNCQEEYEWKTCFIKTTCSQVGTCRY